MNPRNFFAELKRRNVYKVAIAYAVVSWLLVQVASIVFPTFEAPAAAMKVLIVLLGVGFPIALGFAWAFEITPEGIKRESEVEADKSIARHTGRKIVAITIALAIIAGALLAFQILRPKPGATKQQTDTAAAIPEKSIAVLPFDSLSEDKSNAYFADGIQDEILTKLATIADLRVISRTSTAKYKSKPENLKTVSQELGVAKILEGSVQRAGDKVRVNVQLIDARADTHLWAKSYDGDAKDIFGVESEVSQQVADALRAKLSPEEAKTLAKAPTQDPDAYDLFLRAEAETRAAQTTITAEAYDRAVALYAQAFQRDPNFAFAAARMADARLREHWLVHRLNAAQLEEVRATIDRALSLAPDLAAAHIALGSFYYYAQRNYEHALAEYGRALQLQPNNSDALQYCGYIHARQGKWDESIAELNKAAELDPRDAYPRANIAGIYLNLREWSEAKRAASRALALEPRSLPAQIAVLVADVNGEGDVDAAARLARGMEADIFRFKSLIGDVGQVIGARAWVAVVQRDFSAAIANLGSDSSDPSEHRAWLTARATIGVLAGDAGTLRAEAEEARSLLEARLRAQSDDQTAMVQLSWVYLALGRTDDAIRMAEGTPRALPIDIDHMAGPIAAAGLAEVEAGAGDTKRAIAVIRDLLSIPAGGVISIQRLRIDPVWDPIRNDPEFQQLLTLKEHVGP